MLGNQNSNNDAGYVFALKHEAWDHVKLDWPNLTRHKLRVVWLLFDRTRKVHSADITDKEFAKLHQILIQKGYPTRFIAEHIICQSNK